MQFVISHGEGGGEERLWQWQLLDEHDKVIAYRSCYKSKRPCREAVEALAQGVRAAVIKYSDRADVIRLNTGCKPRRH